MRPSEKELPEWHSITKIPLKGIMRAFFCSKEWKSNKNKESTIEK
jgi:hypothetical protein